MRRPKISLENHEQVYRYFDDFVPANLWAHLGYRALSLAYRPRITADEAVLGEIKDHLPQGKLLVAGKHVSNHDYQSLAAMAYRVRELRPLIGNTSIAAKSSLLHTPVVGRGYDLLGAIPVFQRKKLPDDAPAQLHALQKEAGRSFITTAIRHIVSHGRDLAMSPEGGRADNGVVAPLQEGIGKIVCAVQGKVELKILPVGIHYDGSNLTPRLHLGSLIENDFDTPQAALDVIHDRMQRATTQAATS